MNVVITGMGAVSSLGIGVDVMFDALRENRSGAKHYPEWEKYNGLFSHVGAPAPDCDLQHIARSARRTMSRMSEMAVVATLEALHEAKLEVGGARLTPRVALCIGSTTGSPLHMEINFKKLFDRGGPEGQLSTTMFKVMNHTVVSNVASALAFFGPAQGPAAACATAAQAIALGWELLQTGLYDIIIAGGADELHHTVAATFDTVLAASRAYSHCPEEASRPFDSTRDGLVVSEGAGIVVLETEHSAQRREVPELAHLLGGFSVCDGTHMSQTQADSMALTMRETLSRAQISAEQVDYVNAHATSTVLGDHEEAKAIAEVFGAQTPVSSLKGHFGHAMAACGALEVIACIKMMQSQLLLPTRNLKSIDPGCGAIRHVLTQEHAHLRTVLSNNFGFGGMNATLVLRKPQ